MKAKIYLSPDDVCLSAIFLEDGEVDGTPVENGEQVWLANSSGVPLSEGFEIEVDKHPLGETFSREDVTVEKPPWNCDVPSGFSDVKGEANYWLDAVRDFWAEMDMDTDEIELRWIINWFDKKRGAPKFEG